MAASTPRIYQDKSDSDKNYIYIYRRYQKIELEIESKGIASGNCVPDDGIGHPYTCVVAITPRIPCRSLVHGETQIHIE